MKEMGKQKFEKFDLVRVDDELPPFQAFYSGRGEEAIVIGSYEDQYGSESGEHEYTLLFSCGNKISWYGEGSLTLVKENDRESYHKFKNAKGSKRGRNPLDEKAKKSAVVGFMAGQKTYTYNIKETK